MPFPKVIDNTMRTAFSACPLKFRRSHIEHLAPKVPSVHLVAGGAYAKGLETYRKLWWDENQDANTCLHEAVWACVKEWGDHPVDADENKTLENICLAIEEHFRIWPPLTDPTPPFKTGDKHAIEFSFAIPIDVKHPETSDPILYAGRFDYLGLHQDNMLLVVDDKTNKAMGPSYAAQFDLSSQFTGYCWAAKQYGYPVGGAMVKAMCILKQSFKGQPILQMRADWLIEQWYEQLIRDVNRMIWCYENDQWDQSFGDACSAYTGCRYKSLCTQRYPERWLDDYIVREWNPLHVVKEN